MIRRFPEFETQADVEEKIRAQAERMKAEAENKKVLAASFTEIMVSVEGGTFMMGSKQDSSEMPVHSVTLSSFKMSKYEVTQEQWERVMETNPSEVKNCAKCPVENVSWNDVQEFLIKLNRFTGLNYRLPTEAEWEYAAKGGNKSRGYTYSGSNKIPDMGWYRDNSRYRDNSSYTTHPVGKKLPNELGIYDMSGNVWEWCSDWYGEYSTILNDNPQGSSSGSARVVRGGGYHVSADACRVAGRRNSSPGGSLGIGFRVVLSQQP